MKYKKENKKDAVSQEEGKHVAEGDVGSVTALPGTEDSGDVQGEGEKWFSKFSAIRTIIARTLSSKRLFIPTTSARDKLQTSEGGRLMSA